MGTRVVLSKSRTSSNARFNFWRAGRTLYLPASLPTNIRACLPASLCACRWTEYLKDRSDEQWMMSELVASLCNRRYSEKSVAYAESHDQVGGIGGPSCRAGRSGAVKCSAGQGRAERCSEVWV